MSFVAYTPGSYVFGLIVSILFFLAVFGLLVGYFLAEVVEGRVMLVGSLVYWVVALFIGPYVPSEMAWWLPWSMILVLFADVAYMARYSVKRRRGQLKPREAPVV